MKQKKEVKKMVSIKLTPSTIEKVTYLSATLELGNKTKVIEKAIDLLYQANIK